MYLILLTIDELDFVCRSVYVFYLFFLTEISEENLCFLDDFLLCFSSDSTLNYFFHRLFFSFASISHLSTILCQYVSNHIIFKESKCSNFSENQWYRDKWCKLATVQSNKKRKINDCELYWNQKRIKTKNDKNWNKMLLKNFKNVKNTLFYHDKLWVSIDESRLDVIREVHNQFVVKHSEIKSHL